MISNDPKFNLGQLNAYKLMFAIKLSMEKWIKKCLAAWFSDLPSINALVFSNLKNFTNSSPSASNLHKFFPMTSKLFFSQQVRTIFKTKHQNLFIIHVHQLPQAPFLHTATHAFTANCIFFSHVFAKFIWFLHATHLLKAIKLRKRKCQT